MDAGFLLAPAGGLARTTTSTTAASRTIRTTSTRARRPQHYVGGDASYFAGRHELKFGAAWRTTPVDTQQIWPASHLIASWDDYPNMLVQVARDYQFRDECTLCRRLRHRHHLARSADGDWRRPIRSAIVVAGRGVRAGRRWIRERSAAPERPAVDKRLRVEQPHAARRLHLRGRRVAKTVVRGSYAMFASQLPGSIAAFVSPIQYSYAYYNAVDQNGDGVAQLSEVLINQGLQGFYGFDPTNPARTTAVNRGRSGVKPPTTQEWLFGIDREVMPDFALSGTFTYRRMHDLLWTPLLGVTRADYFQTGDAYRDGAGSRRLQRAALRARGGGGAAGRRQDRDQSRRLPSTLSGVEFSATKRLAHHWMARFGFSTNDWREYFDDPSRAILDPTPAPAPSSTCAVRRAAGRRRPGRAVVGRQRQERHLHGRAEVPVRRQRVVRGSVGTESWREPRHAPGLRGAVLPEQRAHRRPARPQDRAARDERGRLPAAGGHLARRARREEVQVRHGSTLALDFDVFNVLNSGTVLGRQYDARLTGPTGFGQVLEIMNPRIARLGVRFVF